MIAIMVNCYLLFCCTVLEFIFHVLGGVYMLLVLSLLPVLA